jgi:hypothetical protein
VLDEQALVIVLAFEVRSVNPFEQVPKAKVLDDPLCKPCGFAVQTNRRAGRA